MACASTSMPHTKPNSGSRHWPPHQACAWASVYGYGKPSNRLRATAGSSAWRWRDSASAGVSSRSTQRWPARRGNVRSISSHRLRKQLAADQHAADLRSAGANLVQLGIAPQPAQRVFVDVAVAAVDLDAFARHPGGLLGAPEDHAGAILAHLPHMLAAELVQVFAYGVEKRSRRLQHGV